MPEIPDEILSDPKFIGFNSIPHIASLKQIMSKLLPPNFGIDKKQSENTYFKQIHEESYNVAETA